MKKVILVCIAIMGLGLTAQAQKVGFVNSQELIAQLPEVKEANANIETLKKQLQKKGEDMIKNLRTKYQSLQKKQQTGEISPIQLEKEASNLKAEETKIAEYNQQSQQKIAEKSQKLLQPIQNKINAAIKAVAAEEGYVYIFDGSMGSILYADDSANVSSKVKAKLGI